MNNENLTNSYDDIGEVIDLFAPAPDTEPERQYYFIAKCREIIQRQELTIGRKLSFTVTTFGCQMNSRDSEKLSGILHNIGYIKGDDEDSSDLVLFNTCTVRENANDRLYGRLGQLKKAKKANENMLVGLCGCMMQESDEVEKIKKSYRHVDLVFGTHNVYKLAEILYNRLMSKKQVIDIQESADKIVEKLPNNRVYKFKSGVNIMFGCNNFCSYCIVPYVRGRERSREPEDIIAEIKELVADGVVEIMLLGQNVNSYGQNLDKPVSFAKLLEEIVKIKGLLRVRFMTSHPKDLSDELIEVMKNNSKICDHLHLPLQSGSTNILKRMNRKYTKESYLSLAKKIKENIPEISLTTDIIVGFPGETEEDFLDTLDVVKQVKYDSAFTFIYSKRTGTPAASMPEQVDKDVVKNRFDRLLKEIQTTSAALAKKNEGSIKPVLVEGVDDQMDGYLTGRLSNNMIVHFKGDKKLIGSIIDVSLDEAKGFYYIGKIVGKEV